MIKNMIVLEVKINEFIHSYNTDPGASLGEVYEALNKMRDYTINRMVEGAKESAEADKKMAEKQKKSSREDKEKKTIF